MASKLACFEITKPQLSLRLLLFSRADWIRTSDPYVPNVVRYRAALLPDPITTILSMVKKSFIKLPPFVTASADFVGWTGFEPATPCPPSKCATGRRHHPPF